MTLIIIPFTGSEAASVLLAASARLDGGMSAIPCHYFTIQTADN
jgi:hypothetical protein